MPTELDAAAIAHDARNALAASHGRLQLMQRLATRGDVDQVRLVGNLDSAIECLHHLTDLLDQLEQVARAPAEPVPDD